MRIDLYTKAVLTTIAVCLAILCCRELFAPRATVHGAAPSLQFTADKDHFYFYDPSDMTVYTYLVVGGHFQNALQLSRAGGDLKPPSGR